MSGANRFLVALALAPAGAMLLTMFGRGQTDSTAGAAIGNRRPTSRSTTGTGSSNS